MSAYAAAAAVTAATATLFSAALPVHATPTAGQHRLYCTSNKPYLPDFVEEWVTAEAVVDDTGRVIRPATARYYSSGGDLGLGPLPVSANLSTWRMITGEVVVTISGRMHRSIVRGDVTCQRTYTLNWDGH